MGSISSLSIWAKASTIMYRLAISHLMAWTTSSAALRRRLVGAINQEPAMSVTTIGLDLAKSIFQVHGVDAAGYPILKRRIRRQGLLAFFDALPPCLVGMEACSSAHHWARELVELGHDVRLIPPQYAKPYVKWNKKDAAEAICEAVGRTSCGSGRPA